MRASYRHGVAWIAENDEPTESSPYEVATQISTLLLADLFGKEPRAVAIDILRKRDNWCAKCENRGVTEDDEGRCALCNKCENGAKL